MNNRGKLIVISGPSGAGKSTVIAKAMERNTQMRFSVSATTRAPRPGEVDGKNYFFVSGERFEEMVSAGEMLEHACYVGNCYGTPKAAVEDMLGSGYDVVLDIEVQGAFQVKERMPEAVMIFLLPGSFDELCRRLTGRGTETEERIQNRLKRAKDELRFVKDYDYIVINNDPAVAADELCSIITAEKCKKADRINLLEEY
jgi:guanylate kinase